MFKFQQSHNVYYVSENGHLVDKADDAIMVYNTDWSNPFPVFMYLNEYVRDEDLGISCSVVKREDLWVVFCVVAPKEKVRKYTTAACRAILFLMEQDYCPLGGWYGEYTYENKCYSYEGIGQTLTAKKFGHPTYNFKWQGGSEGVGMGHYTLEVGDYKVQLAVSDATFLNHKEFLRALGLHCGYEAGKVIVYDDFDTPIAWTNL